MAIDPLTAKLLAQAAARAATDEESRRRTLILILAPILGLLLLIAFILYLITSPFSMLSQWLVGDEVSVVENFQKEYGYNQQLGIYEKDYIEGSGQSYEGVVFTDGGREVIYYNQLDERWADTMYGTSGTIGEAGCGPTAMAIVTSTLTGTPHDPVELSEWSVANGHRCEGNGSYHSLIPAAAEAYGLSWESVPRDDPQAMVDALADGTLVVAIMAKGHFTNSGHFIVLRGVTADICHQIFSQISDRTLLYVAALFHDIAKGRGGDHAELGAEDIVEFARLHGFDRREIETMAWLVKEHLLMSITAQRRDIHDPEVVMSFAESVQNHVRLDYLTCLTVADICATNGTLWNSWKRSLFAALYDYTEQQFRQGMDLLLDNEEKILENRQLALAILSEEKPELSEEKISALWQRCPSDYFLRNSPKQIAWHTELLAEFDGEVLVKISNRFSSGGTEIFVYCPDQANLFNKVVSTIGAKKFSIHDAQILTSDDGYVFDSFIITELNGELVRSERRRELETVLTSVLLGEKLPSMSFANNRQLQHFTVKTDVRFLKETKKEHTELEVVALDKPGLLAQISQIFTELKLNLWNAKITTVGEKAEDFFILTNENGIALSEEERGLLENVLYERL